MSQRTRQLRPEDVSEPREPHVVKLMKPYSCVRKVQVVLMTLLELDSPVLKPLRIPVAIFWSLGVCIYVPASRHWLISYSPIHLT